jgi:HK97 family phage major capsid protein
MTYNTSISRDASNDPLVPTPVSAQIIQELTGASAVLARSRRATMSSKTVRMPVLDVLPTAYFVSGDTGLKQTTTQDWVNTILTAEEIACIVPIPEAYLDDAQVPIWDEVRPRIVEAFGALIDAACLFGTNLPATWSPPIYQSTVNYANLVHLGERGDIAADVSYMGELLALDDYQLNGFATRPGFQWRLTSLRSAGSEKLPIYQPNLQDGRGAGLYGFPLNEVRSGGWNATEAQLIGGDWSMSIVGMRQDISFRIFTEGVISNGAGDVVLNLMQQDSVALRAVMRMGWATARPRTRVNGSTRYPWATLQSAAGTYTYS